MKKLLCVLMFGMMFGQTKLETREYIIPVNLNNDVIDILELTDTNLKFYSVRVYPDIDRATSNCATKVSNLWNSSTSGEWVAFGTSAIESPSYSPVDDFYIINDGFTDERTLLKFQNHYSNDCETTNVHFWVTAIFPEEDTGYIEEGFDYCIEEGANLIASPCRDTVPILDALPSEIANNLTGIIGAGVAATNEDGNWVGSLSGLGGGSGYWMLSNVNACFNYNCAEN